MRPGLPPGAAFLTFGRPDAETSLDSVSLIVDGGLFRGDQVGALDAAFDWFAALGELLDVVYGWGDWETAVMFDAPPTRRDVRAGRVPRLLRFNAFGAALLSAVDLDALVAHATRVRRLPGGALLVEPNADLRRHGFG